jgi:hypothetical protein
MPSLPPPGNHVATASDFYRHELRSGFDFPRLKGPQLRTNRSGVLPNEIGGRKQFFRYFRRLRLA